jgi:DNA-binding transcriptional MerR regulator
LPVAKFAKLRGVTMRALRFYESRRLISPRRDGRVRFYSQRDSERIGLILRAKKLGFTLTEIGQMIDVEGNAATSGGLKLTSQKMSTADRSSGRPVEKHSRSSGRPAANPA